MGETLFKKVDYTLSKLLDQIEMGTLALPDIQRPFVWADTKVRNLFDSMYRGYPIGFFLFWENGFEEVHKQIGIDNKQKSPSLLIVDGQQRLTSLYAVIKGVPIIRKNYEKEYIKIGFNPLKENFAVMDATTLRNPEYIPNISEVWASDKDMFDIVDSFTENLEKHRKSSNKEISDQENKQIKKAISELSKLMSFPFAALELSSSIEEENVAEVFVRINSEGTVLNQADFILTLMSVFWEEGRREIEDFCKGSRQPSVGGASPFNHFIIPEPEHLIRASVGFGFRRARLKYAYALLRGKDLDTGEFSELKRDEQFAILQGSLAETLDIQQWHDFLKCIQMAGFRGGHMVSSKITLIYAYVMYLIGKRSFKIDTFTLSSVIARWFFMTSLTRRYTGGSPETRLERDLTDIRDLNSGKEFLHWIESTIQAYFTEDFWSISLPKHLETSSANTPVLHAYHAAQNLLNAKALYSKKSVFDLLDPSLKAKKASLERHHLFPKAYLKKLGIKSDRDRNQVANYALMEWDDNLKVSDNPPKKYAKELEGRFSQGQLKKMYKWHALPQDWFNLKYPLFLEERRKLIASVIRDGYMRLLHDHTDLDQEDQMTIEEIISAGENDKVEFKSSLRVNLRTANKDQAIEHSSLKTVAAFLNTKGGTLIIGIDDKGSALGIQQDMFESEDKMNLHFVNLIKGRIGPQHMLYINLSFEEIDGHRVLVADCAPSKSPAYLKHGDREQFYIRTGAATTELKVREAQDYLGSRFK